MTVGTRKSTSVSTDEEEDDSVNSFRDSAIFSSSYSDCRQADLS